MDPDAPSVRLTLRVSGRVQGVGFRAWTRRRALSLDVSGSATNLPGGDVEVIAEGRRIAVEQLVADVQSGRAPGRVESVAADWGLPQGMAGFLER